MPIKVVLLFLIVMAVLAMFGRLRFPGMPRKPTRLRGKTCPKCDRHLIGKGDCPCGREA